MVLGLLAFVCAAGASWQAGLAWPAASGRPLARVAAAVALVLGAFGFSLGYWETLSGIGDLLYRFDAPTTRFLFDFAALGLPFAIAGLLLGVASTLHAADVPAGAVIPAVLAGYAVGWVVDPYGLMAGSRMDPVRARYASSLLTPARATGYSAPYSSPQQESLWNYHLGDRGGGDTSGGGWTGGSGGSATSRGSDGGGSGSGGSSSGGGGGGDGEGGGILLLIALAVLAVAGGIVTAALVFSAGRKKAKNQLARVAS